MKYKPDSSGRLRVENKDAMKQRFNHSPDLADRLYWTFVPAFGRVEL